MHTHTQTRCPASVFLLGYHLMCVLHTRANRQQRAESLLSEMNVECRKWETGSKARWVSDYLAYTAMKWVDLSSLASMFVTSSSSELVILWNYDCFVCVKSSCADQGCFCPVMVFCILHKYPEKNLPDCVVKSERTLSPQMYIYFWSVQPNAPKQYGLTLNLKYRVIYSGMFERFI